MVGVNKDMKQMVVPKAEKVAMVMMDFHRADAHSQQPLCQQHGEDGGAVRDDGGGGAVNDAGDEIELSEWSRSNSNLQEILLPVLQG